MLTRLLKLLAVLGAILLVAGFAFLLLLPRFDLGGLVAGRVAAALGRDLRIAGLHVTPGRWIGLRLEGVRLANIPGGSEPAMATLERLEAEVSLLSLLRGPVAVRRRSVEGLRLLLERDGERHPNWHFGEAPREPAGQAPANRTWFPTLLQADVRRSEVTFRTTSGKHLRGRIDTGELTTPDAASPMRLRLAGAYNDTPLTLEARLGAIATLRDAATPYPTVLQIAAGTTTLAFDGTMTEPLDIDSAIGRLTLTAPDPAALLAIAGTTADWDASLTLAGPFERHGDLWRLSAASGALNGVPLTVALLELREGGRGEGQARADAIAVDLALERADLNKVLGAQRPGRGGDADIPLTLDTAPDPTFTAKLAFGSLAYARMQASDVRLAVALQPGRIALDELALTTSGAQVTAAGMALGLEKGARIGAEVTMVEGDLDRLRRDLGLRELPLSGRLTGEVSVAAEGETLNAAARGARVSAVVAMRQGSIAREVVEMASLDLRMLFRDARGQTPVSCLLGVLDMRGGVGTLAPLRIRAASGTIGGLGRFDLNRREVDLVIGSLASTTGSFALDIPVRVSGSFASPSIRPAEWSAAGRRILAARDELAPLPPGLRGFAERNPCFQAGR